MRFSAPLMCLKPLQSLHSCKRSPVGLSRVQHPQRIRHQALLLCSLVAPCALGLPNALAAEKAPTRRADCSRPDVNVLLSRHSGALEKTAPTKASP